MHTATTSHPELEQVRALAHAVDCICEADLCLLAGITPATAESWRKRGRGPSYTLMGNRYLYPRKAVADYVASQVRTREAVSVRGAL